MAQYNFASPDHAATLDQLRSARAFVNDVAVKATGEQARMSLQYSVEQRQYMHFLIPELRKVAEQYIRVMVAMRQELEVKGDLDHFKRILDEQWTKVFLAFDEFEKTLYPAIDEGGISGSRLSTPLPNT